MNAVITYFHFVFRNNTVCSSRRPRLITDSVDQIKVFQFKLNPMFFASVTGAPFCMPQCIRFSVQNIRRLLTRLSRTCRSAHLICRNISCRIRRIYSDVSHFNIHISRTYAQIICIFYCACFIADNFWSFKLNSSFIAFLYSVFKY